MYLLYSVSQNGHKTRASTGGSQTAAARLFRNSVQSESAEADLWRRLAGYQRRIPVTTYQRVDAL
jgi:hypothetical protein